MPEFFCDAVSRLPKNFSKGLFNIEKNIANQITEIRIRLDRPIMISTQNKDYIVNENGTLSTVQTQKDNVCSKEQLEDCFICLCDHSIYTHEENVKEGFLTLSGGHRVGVAGKMVEDDGKCIALSQITSLNIRIARCLDIPLDVQFEELLQQNTPRILIVGQPCSGKTTILRSVTKVISNNGCKVCVIDEREEIWPSHDGQFAYTPPLRCDVLSKFAKGKGSLMAIRSLSPDVIICDEIGSIADTQAMEQSLHAGVGIVATAHANTKEEAFSRPQLQSFFANKVFDYMVVMEGRHKIGDIKEVINLNEYF